MDKIIKISVVIPAYNASTSIVRSIISVYEQTSQVHEVIVVNDGSTDDTVEVVNKYIQDKNLSNLHIFSQRNAGPSAARNKGVKFSTGNYIAFLDADDTWHRNKIEIQKNYINKFPDFAIICGEMDDRFKESDGTEILDFYKSLWKTPFFTSTIVIKKEALIDVRFDENKRLSEDYKLYMTILKTNSALKIKRQIIHYHIDKSGASKSLSSQLWNMEKGELDNYLHFYKKGYINLTTLAGIYVFSLLKFFRRVLVRFISSQKLG